MRNSKILIDETDLQQLSDYNKANPSRNVELSIIQEPRGCKAVSSSLKARGVRWPIEPPPVLELKCPEEEPTKWFQIHNPNWFCVAKVVELEVYPKKNSTSKRSEEAGLDNNLNGSLVSSIHKVKNPDDRNDHGYFVFADLNIRDAGRYKLEFTLFEMRHDKGHVYVASVHSVTSEEFQAPHKIPPTKESTRLSKLLSESGVKIRLRKEAQKKKSKPFQWSATTTDNFAYESHRNQPTALMPLPGPAQMPQPPPNPNVRLGRNSGEDVSHRLSVVSNEMDPFAGAQTQVPSVVGSQSQMGAVNRSSFSAQVDVQNGMYGYALGHQLSPTSRLPPSYQHVSREESAYIGAPNFPLLQPLPQSQPWNFTGQNQFPPESSRAQQQFYAQSEIRSPYDGYAFRGQEGPWQGY